MKRENRNIVQIVLVVAIIAAAVRLGLIWRERHAVDVQKTQPSSTLNPDYYVLPRKLHTYDAKDARELTKQPAWVREGYRYYYYPYDPAAHHVDFKHDAGLLGPIEKLEITDITMQPTPGAPGERQVMAVFRRDNKDYAFPIGMEKGGNYRMYVDDMLYVQDPHELYKHWPSDVWQAIAQHQAKPGMNELQVAFALGMGKLEKDYNDVRTLNYPNGGHPVQVTFQGGKAVDVQPAPNPV